MQLNQTKAPLIVAICGSLGTDSSTRRASELVLEIAQAQGAQTLLLDLRELRLPFAASGFDGTQWPDVARFNGSVREADGLLWATPEYHGSYSGALKNALDLGYEEYTGKAVALLGVAGGAIGATQSLSHLRGVARTLHAICINEQVSIARSSSALDENGQLKDPKLAAGLKHMAVELVRWSKIARQLREEKKSSF